MSKLQLTSPKTCKQKHMYHSNETASRAQKRRNKRDIDRVVKTVKAFTNGYKQVAQFSNGETIYEKGKE